MVTPGSVVVVGVPDVVTVVVVGVVAGYINQKCSNTYIYITTCITV